VPFSFLNPWFWLGALAVAAPVWLHFKAKEADKPGSIFRASIP